MKFVDFFLKFSLKFDDDSSILLPSTIFLAADIYLNMPSDAKPIIIYGDIEVVKKVLFFIEQLHKNDVLVNTEVNDSYIDDCEGNMVEILIFDKK